MGETVVAFGPTKKQKKDFLGVRCPPELLTWLGDRQKESGATLTDAVVWAIQSGRDLYEATATSSDDLARLAAEEGLTRSALLRRVIERGIKAYSTERKQSTRR